MSENYILDGKTPVNESDLLTWAKWFETADRRVALSESETHRVSTVFLGMDHSFGGPVPILFETMVFPKNSSAEDDCARCETWEQAEAQHAEYCERYGVPLTPD